MSKFEHIDCILLIDDDIATNYVNNLVIKKSGIDTHVQIATDGAEGMEYLTCTGKFADAANYPKPSLIFLDINMPRMDGWEFLEAYAALPEEQKGKMLIVMLTTSLNLEDEIRAKSNGNVSRFVNKPLTKKSLQEALTEYFK